uniref:Myosin XIX n=1 Tax=Cyclopterus lumpus TaxID=8103 RepID=A0A8C2X5V8_CYCLU
SMCEICNAFLIDEDQLHTYDDLTKVNPVTPSTVLKCLQARYSVKVFYTHAGCTLVALNPFQPIPDLYTLDVMKEYHGAPQPQEFKPHIFIVAEEAYRNVQGQLEPVNQSLVVSGESGAGKVNWHTVCLLRFRNKSNLLGVLAEPEGMSCCSSSGSTNADSMFVFQMMKMATDEQRKEWKMPPGQCFVWLPNSEKTVCFILIVAFQILAGILQLGNVNFYSSTDESQPCNLDEQSKDFSQRAAELLCVPAEELQMCLRVRMLKAGKQSVLKPCSQAECSMRRDCLAKVIYAQLFDWLVTFINNSICADKSTWCNFIGVLDVYGFECFQINNLEQLCINYANEKLQQHFVSHYLRAQQEEYVSEGLEWSFVKYQDNQSCLDLLEGSPVSVFSLLNEESRLNRVSDAKTLRVRLEKELCDNANISWDKFSKEPHFTVAHYAGKVHYQIQGMVEKNKDPVPPELSSLLQKSDNPLLHQIFTDKETENPTTKGLSKVTVVSKFKNSLESLMKILHTTTPHYTRCIKPNPDCKPLTFKKEEVIMQLEACGIVETIHISAAVLTCPAVVSQLDLLEDQRKKILSQCAFTIQCCWLKHRRRRHHARHQSATLIQAGKLLMPGPVFLFLWQALLKSLAEAELDDAEDLAEEDLPVLNPVIRERGSVQLSSIQKPVTVRGWPMGLALASAPSITMSLTATGFQKMVSVMASLHLPSQRGAYTVKPNQFSQELASIRAQPKGSVKLHYQRSPLLYADRQPDMKSDVTGFNAILLEKTL